MKNRFTLTQRAALLLALSTLNHPLSTFAQGTAFTYQGRLNDGGPAANGVYDFRFRAASDAQGNNLIAGPFDTNAVPVTNGLFAVPVDFGGNIFNGAAVWLRVEVRTNGGVSYATLSPLQPLTPAPYAIFAENVGSGGLAAGTYGKAVTFSNAANSFAGSGSGLTNVNATALNGLGASGFWQTIGNAGTAPGANFLGTTDNQPLELRAGAQRALRLEPNPAPSAPNVIGGSVSNSVDSGIVGATIAGGGSATFPNRISAIYSVIAGGESNSVAADHSSIGGGHDDHIGIFSYDSVIAGGSSDTIQSNSVESAIAGGDHNSISTNASWSFIGGGDANAIGGNSTIAVIAGGYGNTNGGFGAVIGGGQQNFIQPLSDHSVIGGGAFNTIVGSLTQAVYAVIGGGFNNLVQTNNSFSVIAGGSSNQIQANCLYPVISGGVGNVIGANTFDATIGGGDYNSIQAGVQDATIPGGANNTVAGNWAFAAGQQAQANHNGTFVWADSQNAAFSSTAADQFSIRAQGGVRLSTYTSVFFDNQLRQMLNLWGTQYAIGVQNSTTYFRTGARFSWFAGGTHADGDNDPGPGGTVLMTLTSGGLSVNGTFVSASDRNAKENLQPVSTGQILDQVAALPITRWNYRNDPATPHVGPMAQDFYAAFKVGPDNKHIAVVDEGGVALAAIQGLNEKVEHGSQRSEARIQKSEERIQKLEAENAELKQRLETLEQIIRGQKSD